jgi:esterase/lipase
VQVQSDLSKEKVGEAIATADIKLEEPITQQEFDSAKKGMFKKPNADEVSKLLIKESAKVQRLNAQIINAQKANVSTVEILSDLKDTKKKLTAILDISKNRRAELEELKNQPKEVKEVVEIVEHPLNIVFERENKELKKENTELKEQQSSTLEKLKDSDKQLISQRETISKHKTTIDTQKHDLKALRAYFMKIFRKVTN